MAALSGGVGCCAIYCQMMMLHRSMMMLCRSLIWHQSVSPWCSSVEWSGPPDATILEFLGYIPYVEH